jgi:glycosyltransferase domain-containing protein
MHKIIIPTHNRSAKLARTLRCYAYMRYILPFEIIILDGSEFDHQERNIETARSYGNVTHFNMMGDSFNKRIIPCLEGMPDDSLVCISTDEDVFLGEYLKDAFAFLSLNKDYSTYVGRYLTFGRPILGLDRLTHWRDKIISLDINSADYLRRTSLLANTITAGCAPLFWGVRKSKYFLDTFKLFERLNYGPSAEVLDQILLAFRGKIRFTTAPMLLRDETRLGYVYTNDRQHKENYFPPEEEGVISELLMEIGGKDLVLAGKFFLDRYSRNYVDKDGFCFSVQIHNKSYSNYVSIDPADSWSQKFVVVVMRTATIFSEIVSAFLAKKFISRIYGVEFNKNFFKKLNTHKLK